MSERAFLIASKVEAFVRDVVIPYEKDPRVAVHGHGPPEDLVQEMREKARAASVLTPHILADGRHLTQRETAAVLTKSGLSPLGPLACNTQAPDEGTDRARSRARAAGDDAAGRSYARAGIGSGAVRRRRQGRR